MTPAENPLKCYRLVERWGPSTIVGSRLSIEMVCVLPSWGIILLHSRMGHSAEIIVMKQSLQSLIPAIFTLGSISSLLLAIDLPEQHGNSGEKSHKTTDQWIEDLGSSRFDVREAATKALIDLDEPITLRQALRSDDPEVRRRATRILESRIENRARRGLRKACVLAKEGRIDEAIERLSFWKDRNPSGEGWRAVAELAGRLAEWEQRTLNITGFLSPGFRGDLPPFFHRQGLSSESPVAVSELVDLWTRSPHYQGRDIVLSKREIELGSLVALASGTVQTLGFRAGLVISCGSIHMQHGPINSIIISDEDLEVGNGLLGCLVIVRGKFTCHKDSDLFGCTILSGGPVVCAKSVKINNTAMLRSRIPDLPVKFFDVDAAGLSIWQLYRNGQAMPDGCQILDKHGKPDYGDGVWIQEVRKTSPFAAGLRTGDVITAIDGKKAPTKAAFRKLLRRKLAEGGPAITFTVKRGETMREVAVPVKD